jgi:hypothetical protein
MRKIAIDALQELHLSAAVATDSTGVNYSQKDVTVVNYCWVQKCIFHVFLSKIECEKSNFHHSLLSDFQLRCKLKNQAFFT